MSGDNVHPVCAALGSPDKLLGAVSAKLNDLGVDVSTYEADHVCFRCSSIEEYRSTCALISKHGQLLIESMIGGRPIATYLLEIPIRFRDWSIRCVEIPCPKPGRLYASGWEHVEFAIGAETDSPVDRCVWACCMRTGALLRHHLL